MDGDQRSKGSLAAFDLRAGERFGDEVQAGATVLLRDHDAEQAELGHPLDRRHVQTVRNVVLDCMGKDALVDERSYRVLDESLLVGQLEVYGAGPWTRSAGRPGPAAAGSRRPH